MQFNIKVWKKRYDEIQNLGAILKASMPDKDGNPAISPLSRETRASLEKDIDNRRKKVMEYLTATNMMTRELRAC